MAAHLMHYFEHFNMPNSSSILFVYWPFPALISIFLTPTRIKQSSNGLADSLPLLKFLFTMVASFVFGLETSQSPIIVHSTASMSTRWYKLTHRLNLMPTSSPAARLTFSWARRRQSGWTTFGIHTTKFYRIPCFYRPRPASMLMRQLLAKKRKI
jgi:hypothetical protein